jgi:predicted molibdopterin-dependent oxidoreductase YjgC
MTARIALVVDGQAVEVPAGISVAAALRHAASGTTRRSVTGTLRAPVCGMGVCQECRVAIDGRRLLACQTLVAAGMRIATGTAP